MILHDSLKDSGKELPLVSVIIPVYNTQDFIAVCLQSVLNQTYQNFEIICVDDGSSDSSADIIKSFIRLDDRIRLIQIENHGQGYVRNMAVKEAKGKYIQFLDADDFIESTTLDITVARAEEDESDLVIYDWYYYEPIGKTSNYCNKDAFFSESVLKGDDCLRLFEISPIYTVNKLYRKEFLVSKNLTYGEGYIYEDVAFWIKVVSSAKCVSTVHAPFYRVTINATSTTKTNLQSAKHCEGFIRAIHEGVEVLAARTPRAVDSAISTLSHYLTQKFLYYYFARTPKKLRSDFSRKFVEEMSAIGVVYFGDDKFLNACLRRDVFAKKKYQTFKLLVSYYHKLRPRIRVILEKVGGKFAALSRKLKSVAKRVLRICNESTLIQKYATFVKQPMYNDVILFMGFDHRYTGNSRYLFEEMIKENTNKKLFFITEDPRVPLENRIEPESERAYRFIARSKTVIFESWIPPKYTKHNGATWIQLWHGPPLKKMLYDSTEKAIIEKNNMQKISKFQDIKRWDYLLCDNPTISSYFATSFLFPEHKMLCTGYPRVKYLLSHKNNSRYVDLLKDEYGIPKDKKIVLYLPTWRDYNYHVEEDDFDLDYLINLNSLKEKLGDDYQIIYKDHVFLSRSEKVNFKNYDSAETQELLLMADYLVTDYSSVIFDALAAEIPSVIYCNDFEKNEEVRGVYPGMWKDFSPLVCKTEDEVLGMIKNYTAEDTCSMLREKYCYKNASDIDLTKFILSL